MLRKEFGRYSSKKTVGSGVNLVHKNNATYVVVKHKERTEQAYTPGAW